MGDSVGSTNAIDRLLGHTDGPDSKPDPQDAERLDYSKQILGINFTRLDGYCKQIEKDGLIYLDDGDDPDSIRVNVFTDIHNYLSSIYSLVEEIHQLLNQCTTRHIGRRDLVLGSDNRDRSLPAFVRKLVFAWGLRNQFTHGNYRCLTITEQDNSANRHMRVRFNKTEFDPRGKGDLNEVGDYLWGVDDQEKNHPMCYFYSLYHHFLAFWKDLRSWLSRVI
ncbi:hypothetical protein [Halobacterium hubeiense]|uniref:hypothetical protein n=1 Tax=Halobacterium hubeiense TaxID=1407499 RepID=UPI00117A56DD|nr:hypothetical protein [Halobacterium hubeiense]